MRIFKNSQKKVYHQLWQPHILKKADLGSKGRVNTNFIWKQHLIKLKDTPQCQGRGLREINNGGVGGVGRRSGRSRRGLGLQP